MIDFLLKKEFIAPVTIIFVSIIVYYVLTHIVNRLYKIKIARKNDKKRNTLKSVINNIIKYFILVVDLTMILEVYGIDTKSIIASLGVLSLVAGLALQDVLKDFIVGIAVLLEDQFAIGDIVEINGFKGTVVKFGIRTTRIKSYTGEVKIIANRNISELINYTLNENIFLIDVMISYSDDISKVKKVLNNICTKQQRDTNYTYEVLGVDDLSDNGVVIKVAITCPYEDRITLGRKFKEEVKQTFDKEGIEIPFPQVVVHNGK